MRRYKTPLRYPGGKQKLWPFVSEIIQRNDLLGCHYAEPYAGGAGVAIELLLRGYVEHIHLNDSAYPLYAFWRSVVNNTEGLCRKISRASMTVAEWRHQKEVIASPRKHTQLDVGFSFFFLNRCNRSGIISGGVIGGLSQQGEWKMDARFPRTELIQRIEAIALRRRSISITNLDAEEFIKTSLPATPEQTLVYCDPPYFHKADRLYANHYTPSDHRRIAGVIQRTLKRPWIVSYDSTPEILEHYSRRNSFVYDLQYNAAKAYKGKEVFVFSDDIYIPESSSLRYIDRALHRLTA